MAECVPRWASPRTRRRTFGPAVAGFARQLGLDLLPWQRLVLSVALEQSRGRPAYRDCLVSVPRQSGKSSLALALIIWRMLQEPETRVLYGAQTRSAARKKLLLGWWPLLARSPLADRFELYRGFGAEMVTADNGSTLELLSATESSGHGETTDLVIVDEACVHVEARVEQLDDHPILMLSGASHPRPFPVRGHLHAERRPFGDRLSFHVPASMSPRRIHASPRRRGRAADSRSCA
jgi:hypothetical protein